MEWSQVFILAILLLCIACAWLLMKHFSQRKQIAGLIREIETDSLEHHINAIRKKGYEFSLRPGKK